MPTPYRLYVFEHLKAFYDKQAESEKRAADASSRLPGFKPYASR